MWRLLARQAIACVVVVVGFVGIFGEAGDADAVAGVVVGEVEVSAALVAVLAVEALGAENVMGIAMPSRYSSEGSWKDAEKLALFEKIKRFSRR